MAYVEDAMDVGRLNYKNVYKMEDAMDVDHLKYKISDRTARPVVLEEASTNPRQQLLADALDAVSRTEYGGPEASFQRIATLWNAWLSERFIDAEGLELLSAADVAVMLMQLKVARLMSAIDHRDSIVDIAGYAACLAEIVENSDG